MPTSPLTRHRAAASVLALALGATACGLTATQYEASRRFGRASTAVGSFAAAELPRIRDTTIALNVADVAIGGSGSAEGLQGPSKPSDLPPRVLAAEALADYGRLLVALVDDTQAAELQAAADHFVASASSAARSDASNEQLQAAGRLVAAAGHRLVERRKARAVQRIVPYYRPVIDALCQLFRDDFNPKGGRLAQGMHSATVRLLADADIALAEGRAGAQRAAGVEAMRLGEQAQARLDVVYPNVLASLDALHKANEQLAAALEDRRLGIEHIRTFAAEAAALEASAAALGGR